MNHLFFRNIFLAIASVAFVLMFFKNVHAEKREFFSSEVLKKLNQTAEKIDKFYITPPLPQDLIRGSLKGMVHNLDGDSEYLTPFEYGQLELEAGGSFVGIGILLNKEGEYPLILKTLEASPADLAGILPGDEIFEINGRETRDLTLAEVVAILLNDEVSNLLLQVYREKGANKEKISFTIKKEQVLNKSIGKFFKLNDGIGYIQCLNFTEKTAREISDLINKMKKDGLEGIVLDLRDNAGGVFESWIHVS